MKPNTIHCLWLAGFMLSLTGCAHLQSLIEPPEVEVVSLTPQFINLTHIGFLAKLSVKNRLPIRLPLQRMDFKVGVNGRPFVSGALDNVPALGGGASELIDLPFQLGFKEVLALFGEVKGKDTLRLAFSGELHASSQFMLPAVPFAFNFEMPVPRLPKIAFGGFSILQSSRTIGLALKVANGNAFPLQLQTVDAGLRMGQKDYTLAALNEAVSIPAGQAGVVQLRIGDAWEKTAGLFADMVTGKKMDFALQGEIKSRTPYGLMTFPLDTRGKNR
ncbi:LEA type 2 family protein [candidate division FCPU426 bacterium]|nr:LEA type 2 family protein [candidate division FCPU426 bacterium]